SCRSTCLLLPSGFRSSRVKNLHDALLARRHTRGTTGRGTDDGPGQCLARAAPRSPDRTKDEESSPMAQEPTVRRDVPQTTRETVAETNETVTAAAPPPGPTDITVIPGGGAPEHAAGDVSANTLDEEIARAKERFDAAQR